MGRRLAVVPPAPVLLGGLAQRSAPGHADVLAACDEAVAWAVTGSGEIAIVAASPRARDLAWRPAPPNRNRTPAADADLLAGAAGAAPPLGWVVADHLLDRVGYRGVRRRCLVRADAPLADARDDLPDGNLLVLADGSAARGERSPRAGAPGEDFDARLADAFRGADPVALAAIDDTAAARVGCGTAALWRALAGLAQSATCRNLQVRHPFGVAYLIGTWELAD